MSYSEIPVLNELPDPVSDPWAETKFVLYDPHTNETIHVIGCASCKAKVTVSKEEYDRYDSTFCADCARKQH